MTSAATMVRPRWLLLLGGVAAAAVLFFFDPVRTWFYPRCLFHTLTGLQCPGCGSLRALHALLHGDFGHALALNPLLFLAGLFFGYVTIRKRLRPQAPSLLSHPAMMWVIPAVIILYWIARNLPPVAAVLPT